MMYVATSYVEILLVKDAAVALQSLQTKRRRITKKRRTAAMMKVVAQEEFARAVEIAEHMVAEAAEQFVASLQVL
jgi:hypothetical protein